MFSVPLQIELPDIGRLLKLRIWHEKRNPFAGWHLAKVKPFCLICQCKPVVQFYSNTIKQISERQCLISYLSLRGVESVAMQIYVF